MDFENITTERQSHRVSQLFREHAEAEGDLIASLKLDGPDGFIADEHFMTVARLEDRILASAEASPASIISKLSIALFRAESLLPVGEPLEDSWQFVRSALNDAKGLAAI